MEKKVTLITTVKNEERSIESFLESIKLQTRKPDEVVIADGGSTDNTLNIIQKLKFRSQSFRSKFKVIYRRGNRSVGRNAAIQVSSGNIIAVTDAGCILDKYWLEQITKPFSDKTIDVVAGFYKPLTTSIFQKCLSTYTCTMPDKLDKDTFLPSSRSIAFRKNAWKKVKGYPEHLNTCEDLVFDKKLKEEGFRFITKEKAIVYWPQRKNILEAAKQFFSYAKGDGEARFFRKSTPLLLGRYLVGLGFLGYIFISMNYSLLTILYLLFVLYLLWAIYKNYRYIKKRQAYFYLPLLQVVSDVAVITGTTFGLLKTYEKHI